MAKIIHEKTCKHLLGNQEVLEHVNLVIELVILKNLYTHLDGSVDLLTLRKFNDILIMLAVHDSILIDKFFNPSLAAQKLSHSSAP